MRQQILEVLISSSVLILALALLRILLRGKISPRLQFGLWLLVAVRLLVPVSIGQSAASVMNYVPEQQMAAVLEEASVPAQVPQAVTALPMEPSAITDEPSAADTPSAAQMQEAQAVSSDTKMQNARVHPAPLTICYFVWGIGAALALIVMLGQNAVLAARLKRNRVRLEVPECKNSVYITEILPSSCLFHAAGLECGRNTQYLRAAPRADALSAQGSHLVRAAAAASGHVLVRPVCVAGGVAV